MCVMAFPVCAVPAPSSAPPDCVASVSPGEPVSPVEPASWGVSATVEPFVAAAAESPLPATTARVLPTAVLPTAAESNAAAMSMWPSTGGIGAATGASARSCRCGYRCNVYCCITAEKLCYVVNCHGA